MTRRGEYLVDENPTVDRSEPVRPLAIGHEEYNVDPRFAGAGVRAESSRVRRPPAPYRRPPQASTPWPLAAPDLWDTLTLAGVGFLGTAEVDGDPIGVDLDVSKPSGRDGGTIRDKGVKLAKLRFTLHMWDVEGWASWDALLPVIDPRRQVGRRTPVDVEHPALAQRGIGRVYIESIALPKVKDGAVDVVINAIEFRPPSPRPTSRTAARPAGTFIEGTATAFTGLVAVEHPVAPSTSAEALAP